MKPNLVLFQPCVMRDIDDLDRFWHRIYNGLSKKVFCNLPTVTAPRQQTHGYDRHREKESVAN